jgi:glycosyltransferase involved in cell wall biosynthesis
MTTVLQIIPGLGAGGAEQACVDVAAGLVKAGHHAIVVSSGGSRVAEVEKAGAEHITRPAASKNPAIMLANAFWLAKLVRARKIDILHARSRAPAWSAYWAARMTGCTFVTTFHAAYKFSNPVKKLYNGVMAKADRVIAISEFVAAYIRDAYGADAAKIRVIPRGIDWEKFAPEKVADDRRAKLRQAWGVKEGQKIILMPARLSRIKGHKVLIEALALLPPSDVITAIPGDDQGRTEYRHELETLIAAKGLGSRVRLVPHCADMPAAYSLAALAVAPSLTPEGFGRVPVEAVAMGVPVIASAIGGFTETIVHGQTGWLVPPGDARKLADAIGEAFALETSARAALVQKAISAARARYDRRKMVADTLAVYAELARA